MDLQPPGLSTGLLPNALPVLVVCLTAAAFAAAANCQPATANHSPLTTHFTGTTLPVVTLLTSASARAIDNAVLSGGQIFSFSFLPASTLLTK
jgi:hypothetical protein